MTHQITMTDVTFTYPGQSRPQLKHVTLSIKQGAFVAIMGGNGSGKSTLCKCLNGLIPHYYVGDYTGKTTINSHDTTEVSVSALSKHVGYVYQDFENQLVSPRVLDDACFAPLHFGLSDFKARGERALELMAIDHLKDRYIWQLSGGQKHLLALSGILSLNPDIIIVDEPVSQLDPFHAEVIYKQLKALHQQGKTVIVIEHHASFVARYAEEVILMSEGELLTHTSVREALENDAVLSQAGVYPPEVTMMARKMKRHDHPLPLTIDEAERYFRPLLKQTEENQVESMPTVNKNAAVQLKGVSFHYQSLEKTTHQVFDQLDLSLYQGERVALIGNNGAGKSSLMKLLTGQFKPKTGQIKIFNEDINKQSPEQLAEYVTYIHQNPEHMFIDDSVEKDIGYFLKMRHTPNLDQRVATLLERFDLTSLKSRDARLLSGGQMRRTSLAIGEGTSPRLLLLDEPTATLDMVAKQHVKRLMQNQTGEEKTIVMATHDVSLVFDWATRVIVLNNGQIIFDGVPEQLVDDYHVLNKAGIILPEVVELSRRLELPLMKNQQMFIDCLQDEVI
ncbi:energy-coupling factor transport system ATP-binding protein [Streptohalobacillus salinus]|uniref:Energy-coupling factor transport system ATP-binding protein n=1 Tax=Streptohalobacillus salinus TaxID=621096 RepID=A0A2V3W689_9BACI|nr:ABC transporter ATP-binding protein [Streptohalobacillus salinus]PXW89837.1 energy-coupling factor transport system ATP-binding protein [Streptohalobacillus salinus]